MRRARLVTLVGLLGATSLSPRTALADLPHATVDPLPLGVAGPGEVSLEFATGFSGQRFAYGPAAHYRSEGGFLVGGGLFPNHRNTGPFTTELGFGMGISLGYGFEIADVDIAIGDLVFESGFRFFGQMLMSSQSTFQGGGALALAIALRAPSETGLERIQIFGEYIPAVGGALIVEDEGDPQYNLHGLRVGGSVVYDIDEGPDLKSGVLFRAALDIREAGEATRRTEFQVGVGLVF